MQLFIQDSKQIVRLTGERLIKSLAGNIEGDDSSGHWKTTTKESTKGCQAPVKTISFADGVKKRRILNVLNYINYCYCTSIRVWPHWFSHVSIMLSWNQEVVVCVQSERFWKARWDDSVHRDLWGDGRVTGCSTLILIAKWFSDNRLPKTPRYLKINKLHNLQSNIREVAVIGRNFAGVIFCELPKAGFAVGNLPIFFRALIQRGVFFWHT